MSTARTLLPALAALLIGFWLGGWFDALQGMARGRAVMKEARELLGTIEEFRASSGKYPDQAWFEALGPRRITSEGRLWQYHDPPRTLASGGRMLISVPIDKDHLYVCGFAEGGIHAHAARDLEWNGRQVATVRQRPRRIGREGRGIVKYAEPLEGAFAMVPMALKPPSTR